MKKRILAIMLAVVCVCSFSLTAIAAEEPPITVMVDGKVVDCESYGQSPIIIQSRTMIPLRAIFEALGATVEWDDLTQTVTSTRKDITLSFTVGKSAYIRNGEYYYPMDMAPQLINGRTMIPVRAVAEGFKQSVKWDEQTSTVMIFTDDYEKPADDEETIIKQYATALKKHLNDTLVRPDTLQIYKVYTGYHTEYYQNPFAVCFDLSAMNTSGGYTRKFYTVHISKTNQYVFNSFNTPVLIDAKEYPVSIIN